MDLSSSPDNPRAPDDGSTEITCKRQKIDATEQDFDDTFREFMDGKQDSGTGWRARKGHRNPAFKKQRDEELNKKRNISSFLGDNVSSEDMEIELSKVDNNNDAQDRNFLINEAALASVNKDNDKGASQKPPDNHSDVMDSDTHIRNSSTLGKPTDTQQEREIYMVCGMELN